MGLTKSTYQQVIDDLQLDMQAAPGTNYYTDAAYQNWINRATSHITNDINIEEQTTIGLCKGESVYDITFLLREIKSVKKVQRTNHPYLGVLREVRKEQLLDYEHESAISGLAVSSLTAPEVFSLWREQEHRYIEFYPVPQEAENVTIFYYLGFSARDHQTEDTKTTEIFLPQEYEPLLVWRVKAEVYASLGNEQMHQMMLGYYEKEKRNLEKRDGYASQITMCYT